jgi:hypothetical protein
MLDVRGRTRKARIAERRKASLTVSVLTCFVTKVVQLNLRVSAYIY